MAMKLCVVVQDDPLFGADLDGWFIGRKSDVPQKFVVLPLVFSSRVVSFCPLCFALRDNLFGRDWCLCRPLSCVCSR